MRVAIIGSRPEVGRAACLRDEAIKRDAARATAIAVYIATLPPGTIVVHGDAQGADLWADGAAANIGVQRVRFPAAWLRADGTTDRSAGHRRNALIAEYADRCVAFYGAGESRGTDGCVALFRKLGKPVECRDWKGEVIER